MSEAERKRRFEYKQNRSKWIRIQALAIAIVSILTLLFSITYYKTSKNYYINYTEKSEVDYRIYLKENEFYNEKYLGKDQVYIASLIDKVVANFNYELNMEEEVNYSYSYKINAIVKVADRLSGVAIYNPSYTLIPETVVNVDSAQKKLTINKQVEVDYAKYNDIANNFIGAYKLNDVESSVILEMEIDVVSDCENFQDKNSRNKYVVSLNVPLTEQKVNIQMTSSVPESETKILACSKNVNKTLFLILFIVAAVIDVLLIALLVAFVYLTRNTDINYEIKVNRIISSYKSYIQKIINPFNEEGYQLLFLDTFREMLEIRDTIQSPILMNENEDKTCTRFIIPTHTKLLYVFEIKVDDYDEIYKTEEPVVEEPVSEEPIAEETEVEEAVIEEVVEEPVILVEETNEEQIAEAMAEPSVPLSSIDYDMDDDEDADEGVEVIGVVWPERPTHNKVYRYDPNGEKVTKGDIVLVPSRDAAKNRDIIRKATVAHGNHKVDPDNLHHPLKKIIGIVKRKAEAALMPRNEDEAK